MWNRLISCPNRTVSALCIAMALVASRFEFGMADDAPPPETTAKTLRLNQMRERAKRATVRIISDASKTLADPTAPVELVEQPLFRYNDEPRKFRDGSLWLWTAGGRPVAVGKIEDWRGSDSGPMWITCFASLSTALIDSKWQDGPAWASKKPGLPFQVVAEFEKPETTDSGRLRQFKKLSERFTLSLERGATDRQELRRLPRFLHRYQLPDSHIVDSVMFGWTANGTNPDAMLVLELRSSDGQDEWHYAMSPVSADKIEMQLDGAVVQSKPYTPFTGDETVRYFFEKNTTPLE